MGVKMVVLFTSVQRFGGKSNNLKPEVKKFSLSPNKGNFLF